MHCAQSDDVSSFVGPAAKIIERMVNQNTFDDVTQGLLLTYTLLIYAQSRVKSFGALFAC